MYETQGFLLGMIAVLLQLDIDQDLDSSVGHVLDLERHRLWITHGGDPLVLHHLGVDPISMTA